jgi:ubiquinone/menaquinone biosynthesis C-methylase UbiE
MTKNIYDVEKHWEDHTVKTSYIIDNSNNSLSYIKEIDRLYPLYMDLFHLYDPHNNETIIDYGCGPGNDLVGFYNLSKCKKIYGIDISTTALKLATDRLLLHNNSLNIKNNFVNNNSIELIKVKENNIIIPLNNNSIDYIQSSGVIHHTSNPVY